MRKNILVHCVLVLASLGATPLMAATITVSVGRNPSPDGVQPGTEALVFTPNVVNVGPTDTVVFQQSATATGHNVVADDDTFTSGTVKPGTWSLTVGPFAAGTAHLFYCAAHGAPGGVGMSGSIVVGTTPVRLQGFDVQ